MSIVLGRLALLSALSTLVLGVLWTHIKRKVWLIFDTLSAYPPLSVLFVARGRLDRTEHLSSEQDVITRDHPKFTDRSFERTTKQVSRRKSGRDLPKRIVKGKKDYKLRLFTSVGVSGREMAREQNSDGI